MIETRSGGTDWIIQLLECCKDLTRNDGGTVTEMTEDEVLTAMSIKGGEHYGSKGDPAQHEADRDEPIHAYEARLTGQVSVCKFTQECTGCGANVNYTEAMLKDSSAGVWKTPKYRWTCWETETKI